MTRCDPADGVAAFGKEKMTRSRSEMGDQTKTDEKTTLVVTAVPNPNEKTSC
jgi:hypothetical protein